MWISTLRGVLYELSIYSTATHIMKRCYKNKTNILIILIIKDKPTLQLPLHITCNGAPKICHCVASVMFNSALLEIKIIKDQY